MFIDLFYILLNVSDLYIHAVILLPARPASRTHVFSKGRTV